MTTVGSGASSPSATSSDSSSARGSTALDAIGLMQSGRYRNVPILNEMGRVAGIVRQQDVLRMLAESFPEELLNLPPRPHQTADGTEGA
jgi:CBS-domain-containing membrane protein